MGYQPIETYGIIGDLHTIALVGMNGSIDWFCFPSFDSPSVFAAILDSENGGRFQIIPTVDEMTFKQIYWPDTNVLVTRFLSAAGVAEVTDYMPIDEKGPWQGEHHLVRRVRVVRGSMPFRMVCQPVFNYARDKHKLHLFSEGACFESPSLRLGLATDIPLKGNGKGGVMQSSRLAKRRAPSSCFRGCRPERAAGRPSLRPAKTKSLRAP